jgi:hypothetical protein
MVWPGKAGNDMNDWLDEWFTGFIPSLTSVYCTFTGGTFVCDGSLEMGCIGETIPRLDWPVLIMGQFLFHIFI